MQTEVSALYRAAIWNAQASLSVLDTSALKYEARRRHHLSQPAADTLGRALTAAAFLCGWLEEDGRLALVIDGGGNCGKIRVSGNGRLELSGYLESDAATGTIEECVGKNGTFSVAREEGGLPFTGACRLAAGDITADLAAYLQESEQRPTAAAIFERTDGGSGGVFIQPLPGAEEEILRRAKRFLSENPLKDMEIKQILSLFGAENAEKREVRFLCSCSREKAERAVLSLGETAARELIKEQGDIKVHCHECNTDYTFDGAAVGSIFKRR